MCCVMWLMLPLREIPDGVVNVPVSHPIVAQDDVVWYCHQCYEWYHVAGNQGHVAYQKYKGKNPGTSLQVRV